MDSAFGGGLMSRQNSAKVLIYDSNKDKALMLERVLLDLGFVGVEIQAEYTAILSLVKKLRPNIIIIGDPFKERPSADDLRELKAESFSRRIPRILCTNFHDAKALRDLVAEGVSALISCPPNTEGVKRALRSFKKLEQTREVIALLRKTPFFNAFTKEELGKLIKIAIPKSFQNGSTIIEQDDPADTFYFLLKGKVEAVIMNEGKSVLSIPIKEGNPFGEMGVLDKSFRGACCIAVDDCIVLEVGSPVLEDESCSIRTKIFAKLTEVLVKRLRAMNDLVREVSSKEARDPLPDTPAQRIEKKPKANESAKGEKEEEKGAKALKKQKIVDSDPAITDLEDVEFEDNGLDYGDEGEKVDVFKNPYANPTGTCDEFDTCVRSQEEYDVFTRKVKLRTDFILQKIPKNIYELMHNKLYGYWTGGKLAKFNPHRRWSPKLFTDGSCRLKKSLHVVAVCPWGVSAFKDAYLGLYFTHRAVQVSTSGCSGTFLSTPSAIERFFAGFPLEKAIKFDLEMPIDRLWKGADCIEFLTHTTEDVRPYTLFVVFDRKDGTYTRLVRDAFPEHQIVTIVQGYGFDPDEPSSLFTFAEEKLVQEEILVQKKNYVGKGFYQGETFFLPDLSYFYKGTDRLGEVGYIFGTLGALALMGPDYSGVTWGSKGGAEGAVKAARAMYGMKGAGSAKELADAINWADE